MTEPERMPPQESRARAEVRAYEKTRESSLRTISDQELVQLHCLTTGRTLDEITRKRIVRAITSKEAQCFYEELMRPIVDQLADVADSATVKVVICGKTVKMLRCGGTS